MHYQEWEFFPSLVDPKQFSVNNTGPLPGPINSFTVTRDKKQQIILKTISSNIERGTRNYSTQNLVKAVDGEVHFQGNYNKSTAIASGILPRGYHITLGPESTHSVREDESLISSLTWSKENSTDPVYVIDWIENLSGSFIWPHTDEIEEKVVRVRRLHTDGDDVVVSSEHPSTSTSRTCARITIGNWNIIVGVSSSKPENIKHPGFILYFGCPNEETRSRIRGCLSFLLGDYFVYLGCTSFDAQWKPVGFRAVSGHALVDEALNISGMPPSPLGRRFINEIDPAILSNMASSLFSIYEDHQLNKVFWNYWHAKAAPVHMAAAHFGAAIESLQNIVFKMKNGDGRLHIVADKTKWKTVAQKIEKLINGSELSSDETRLLINKLGSLNFAPQSVVSEKFFQELNLHLSSLEKRVWSNRNRAAHGGGIASGREIQSIRENKVLMMLVHRIVLSLSGASNIYYDYYNLGNNLRPLADALPEEGYPGNQ